jgi:GTP 3',8-cyclase
MFEDVFKGKSNKKIMLINSIYRKIPYKYSISIKNLYHKLLKLYLKTFYVLKYKNMDMFNDVNIETTTLCNRRCDYCPNSIYDRSLKQNEKLMSEAVFTKIIDDLKKIKFCGRLSPHLFGEPLLDKRMVKLMKYAHDNLPKTKLVIYTNGDLLSNKLLEDLYKAGVKNYVVALHGNGLENEANSLRICNIKKQIHKSMKSIKIDLIKFHKNMYLSNRGGLVKGHKVTDTMLCQYANNPLVINYKGDVLLCCNDYFGKVVFGNIENESLLTIWNKEGFKKIRKEVKKKIFKLDICKTCI